MKNVKINKFCASKKESKKIAAKLDKGFLSFYDNFLNL